MRSQGKTSASGSRSLR